MKHVIILNGPPEAGKGVFVGFFDEPTTHSASIVDGIRHLAFSSFGWKGKKDAAGRKLLSDLYLASMAYDTAPLHNIITLIFTSQCDTIIIDVRDTGVIERLRKIVNLAGLKCTTVHIVRDVAQAKAEETGLTADCSTDGPRDFMYDLQLVNNGTIEEFKALATSALGKLE